MKMTEWYSGDQKPTHVGAYHRDYMNIYPGGVRFCWWDGSQWCALAGSPDDALIAAERGLQSIRQFLPWRGVKRD